MEGKRVRDLGSIKAKGPEKISARTGRRYRAFGERTAKRFTRDLDHAMAQGSIQHALDNLQRIDWHDWWSPYRIECRLHRIVVTGGFRYKQLTRALGPLHEDKAYDPVKEKFKYQRKYIRKKPDFTLVIRLEPIERRPHCYIEIIPHAGAIPIVRYKAFLQEIDALLPGLNVSKVEYATDQFCKPSLEADDEGRTYYTGQAVEALFRIEKRYLCLPFQRKAPGIYGENLTVWGSKARMSYVCRVGSDKLYERGPNNRKVGEGWPHVDTDRVRLEHTAGRAKLRRNGIGRLSAFIQNPKFHQMNEGVFRFCHFQRSDRLPGISSNYTPDENGHYHGSFQAELVRYRKKVNNINQYIVKTKYFQPLVDRFNEVWQDFDREWAAT